MKTTRREFLKQGAATAAVACATWNLKAQVPTKPRTAMTIDLTPGAIGVQVKNQRELNALAHKHGFQSVQPRASEFVGYSKPEFDALLADMQDKKLAWGSAGMPVEFRKDEATFQSTLQSLPAQAKALKAVGGDRMNTWLSPSSDDLTYLQNFKQHTSRLREIAKILNDHGIRFGLEYVGTLGLRIGKKFPFVHCLAEATELIQAIDVSNVGFVLDSWHWWTAMDSIDDIQKLANQQIVAVDLNDAPIGIPMEDQKDNQRELPTATGVIDLRSFLNALNSLGYDGPVRAEPFNKPLNQLDNDEACAKTSAALKKAFGLLS